MPQRAEPVEELVQLSNERHTCREVERRGVLRQDEDEEEDKEDEE